MMSEEKYWNEFYNRQDNTFNKVLPSQFATFILNEIYNPSCTIVDFGCGNGRDSFFFADYNFKVIGVDRSEKAIESCIYQQHPNTSFINSTIENNDLFDQLDALIDSNQTSSRAIYSRFFLHAIDKQQQDIFIKLARALLSEGELFFLEFRTDKDKYQEKVTDQHYRRFINSLTFVQDVCKEKFKVIYFVEGFGYAKFRNDDAYVARFILEAI